MGKSKTADNKNPEKKPAAAERGYPRIVVPPPGPKGREVIKTDKQFSSTSYAKVYPLVIAKGEGAVVEDIDGNRYVDFMAGIAVASTGYSHPQVVAAVQEAAGKFFSMCSTDWYYEKFSQLVETLAHLAPGQSSKRVFLTNSGTEANEGAIKLSRVATGRKDLIAFQGAFHGRTYGAMSLTSSKVAQRAAFGPFIPGVHHVPYPNPYRLEVKDPVKHVIDYIEKDLFKRHVAPTDVAAVFVEPMLGEGGYVVPPREFLLRLRELCDRYGILLVADEVQTGMGRTGKMWAVEHSGIEPDIITSAKGLASGMPLGAIIAKEAVMKWEPGSHGSTYGGNSVCCAAALATIEAVKGGLMQNAQKMGRRLLDGALALQEKYPCIGDVRGQGLFIGVEFVKDRESKEPAKNLVEDIMQRAFRKGLLLLSCGDSTIRLAPPLVIDDYGIEKGLEILDATLKELT